MNSTNTSANASAVLGVVMHEPAYLLANLELSAALAEDEIVVFPDGRVEMLGEDDVFLDSEAASAVIAQFNDRGVQIPVDYEHSTKHKASKGEPSPAAGWIDTLRYEQGTGLIGHVTWNPEAKAAIKGQKYKYLSPHFMVDTDSRKLSFVLAVALTNTPRIKNMRELVAASAANLGAIDMSKKTTTATLTIGGDRAKLQEIFAAFGASVLAEGDSQTLTAEMLAALEEYADEMKSIKAKMVKAGRCGEAASATEVLSALMGLCDQEAYSDGQKSIADKLGLEKAASVSEICASIDKLRTGTVDAAEYKKVTERLGVLEAENRKRASQELVASAIEAAKLNPNNESQMTWARKESAENPDGFKRWAEAAPALWTGERLASNVPADAGSERKKIILANCSEWNANRVKIGLDLEAWVNQGLRDKGQPKLTDAERKSLTTVEV